MFCWNYYSWPFASDSCSFESNIAFALCLLAWFDTRMNRAGELALSGINGAARLTANVAGVTLTYGTLAAITLTIPLVYHAQFRDQFQSMTTWDRTPYGICEFLTPKAQLMCAVTSRTVFRVMDYQHHHPAACTQSTRIKKFLWNRGTKWESRQENWDKTALAACVRLNQNSPDPIRQIKVRFCGGLLEMHQKIDRLCKS